MREHVSKPPLSVSVPLDRVEPRTLQMAWKMVVASCFSLSYPNAQTGVIGCLKYAGRAWLVLGACADPAGILT